MSTFASTLERCLLVLEPCFERFSNFAGVWTRDYYIFTSNEASFRDRARSFCGKNVQRFVRDRREHVFRPVSNLTGYHGLGRSFYETPPSIAPSRKVRQLHACIWIIVRCLERSSVKVDVEIASKFSHRDNVSAARSIHKA